MAEEYDYQEAYTTLYHQYQELAAKSQKESAKRRALNNRLVEAQGNIRVLCRVRPLSESEISSGEGADITEFPSDDEIVLNPPNKIKPHFEFDGVFQPNSTQAAVFEAVQPLLGSCLDGYSVCVFAYGQTGTGKTFTMEGTAEHPGINLRAVEDLFNMAAERAPAETFQFYVSALEVSHP